MSSLTPALLMALLDAPDRVKRRNKFVALYNALAILGGKTRDMIVTDDD